MNLMQNNYFGYVYGESIDEIINECNLAKNLEIIKDDGKDLRVDGKDKFNRVLIKRKEVV